MDIFSTKQMPLERKRVAIVGAGVSGMCACIRLKHYFSNPEIKIYERCEDVGGTWLINTYPSAACDVPSMFYCFSFNPNPNWSQYFSPQQEILQYMQSTAKKFDVYKHISFGTEFLGAQWDEERQLWRFQTAPVNDLSNVTEAEAEILVVSSAALNRPSVPHFKGLENYKGKVFHTAQWDHSYDLTNKKVCVIGTGASAVQVVPGIASKTKDLTVFQRTPGWAVPRRNYRYPQWVKTLFTYFPVLMAAYRLFLFILLDVIFFPAFQQGTISEYIVKRVCRKHVEEQVKDEKLRAALIPNYPPGCKRMLITTDYFKALSQPNVHLETSAISHFDGTGIVTADGKHHDCDVVVMATGFQVTSFLSHLNIVGRDNVPLSKRWRSADDVEAYYGTVIRNCPNLFVLLGPNTALGHSSVIFIIENQVEYMCKLLREMTRRRATSVDVKQAAHEAYNQWIQKNLSTTVWAGNCHSWYKTESGKIVTLWPHSSAQFWWTLSRPKFDELIYTSNSK